MRNNNWCTHFLTLLNEGRNRSNSQNFQSILLHGLSVRSAASYKKDAAKHVTKARQLARGESLMVKILLIS